TLVGSSFACRPVVAMALVHRGIALLRPGSALVAVPKTLCRSAALRGGVGPVAPPASNQTDRARGINGRIVASVIFVIACPQSAHAEKSGWESCLSWAK